MCKYANVQAQLGMQEEEVARRICDGNHGWSSIDIHAILIDMERRPFAIQCFGIPITMRGVIVFVISAVSVFGVLVWDLATQAVQNYVESRI